MRTEIFIRSRARRAAIFPALQPSAQDHSIDFALTTPNIFIPIRPRDFNRTARTVPPKLSIQRSFRGRIQSGPA